MELKSILDEKVPKEWTNFPRAGSLVKNFGIGTVSFAAGFSVCAWTSWPALGRCKGYLQDAHRQLESLLTKYQYDDTVRVRTFDDCKDVRNSVGAMCGQVATSKMLDGINVCQAGTVVILECLPDSCRYASGSALSRYDLG